MIDMPPFYVETALPEGLDSPLCCDSVVFAIFLGFFAGFMIYNLVVLL
jgi:hypothetical protein